MSEKEWFEGAGVDHTPKAVRRRPDLAAINRIRSALFRAARAGATEKRCGKCGETKPINQFGKQSKTHDGRQTWCLQCFRRHNRDYLVALRASLRAEVIAKLGGCCKRCGFADARALQVDHVNGDGFQERQENHSNHAHLRRVLADRQGRYQLLCANCNWIKRHENNEGPKPKRA